MKLITRDTDYALRALCFIAKQKNKKFTVPDLVRQLKIPKPFLRKILQQLNKKGILNSSKGVGGGFILAKQPSRIFLADIIRIFQGPLRLNECFFRKLNCPKRATCTLRKRISRIEDCVIKELKTISVASLLD
jgi:Rrf2 family protein